MINFEMNLYQFRNMFSSNILMYNDWNTYCITLAQGTKYEAIKDPLLHNDQ
jgi:hypothetical protein